jgi:hypothetical protein
MLIKAGRLRNEMKEGANRPYRRFRDVHKKPITIFRLHILTWNQQSRQRFYRDRRQ